MKKMNKTKDERAQQWVKDYLIGTDKYVATGISEDDLQVAWMVGYTAAQRDHEKDGLL